MCYKVFKVGDIVHFGKGSLGSEFYAYSKVLAWQPLPESYKEVNNEQ